MKLNINYKVQGFTFIASTRNPFFAQNVWKGITSAMVCRAFILAYRIMNKIIEEDGNNAWLCHGTPHCYVRRDFVDSYDGVVPYFGVETTETRVGTETTVDVTVDM